VSSPGDDASKKPNRTAFMSSWAESPPEDDTSKKPHLITLTSQRPVGSFMVPAYLASWRYIVDSVLEEVLLVRFALEPILHSSLGFFAESPPEDDASRKPNLTAFTSSSAEGSPEDDASKKPHLTAHVVKAGRQFHGPCVPRQLAIHRGLGARARPPG